jgi:undecaprenyl diphosphate synthase
MNPIAHIAIIMDGNGRWALKRRKPRNAGHRKGLDNISEIINYCKKQKVKHLTLFVFSLDNWKRSPKEILYLFKLLENFLDKYKKKLLKEKIKINFLGERKKLDKNFYHKILSIENETAKDYEITVNLAFNYSSKAEIVSSFNKILKNKLNKKITPSLVEKNLYTSGIPDPEILIRTGGKNRLSDFLLWQISYSEIFFIKKLWPDFKSKDLNKIVNEYKKIKRNFGGIND